MSQVFSSDASALAASTTINVSAQNSSNSVSNDRHTQTSGLRNFTRDPYDAMPLFNGDPDNLEGWFTAVRARADASVDGPPSESLLISIGKESLARSSAASNVFKLIRMKDFQDLTRWQDYEQLIRNYLEPVRETDPFVVLKELVCTAPRPEESLEEFALRLNNLMSSFVKAGRNSRYLNDSDKPALDGFARLAAFGVVKQLMPPTSKYVYNSSPLDANMGPLKALIHVRNLCPEGSFPYRRSMPNTLSNPVPPLVCATTKPPNRNHSRSSSKASVKSYHSRNTHSTYSNHSQIICYNCGFRGHIASNCYASYPKKRRTDDEYQSDLPYCTHHRIHGHDTSECNALYNMRYSRSFHGRSNRRARRGNRRRGSQSNQNQAHSSNSGELERPSQTAQW
ncbi:uncharacterized protein [Cherax quadricarinatus]|uniref:uncharacterized protein n=1 Tax=Cherax quadricarinatus TaxID=27406 RepID=UPI00387E5367